MNVIAWYCCMLRTNGVDLKIVNLLVAIFIRSRVYKLLRGGVNARRCQGRLLKVLRNIALLIFLNIFPTIVADRLV